MTLPKKYEDGLPLGVIGIFRFMEITDLQILIQAGNGAQYEATMLNKDREVVAVRTNPSYQALRLALAEEMHIGLKYTDAVLDNTLDYHRRLKEAEVKNTGPQLLSQFETKYVTYSVIEHPTRVIVKFNPNMDRVEPAFYVIQAQAVTVEDPDQSLLLEETADSLFDAVVIVRNHIEQALMAAFFKGEIKP